MERFFIFFRRQHIFIKIFISPVVLLLLAWIDLIRNWQKANTTQKIDWVKFHCLIVLLVALVFVVHKLFKEVIKKYPILAQPVPNFSAFEMSLIYFAGALVAVIAISKYVLLNEDTETLKIFLNSLSIPSVPRKFLNRVLIAVIKAVCVLIVLLLVVWSGGPEALRQLFSP